VLILQKLAGWAWEARPGLGRITGGVAGGRRWNGSWELVAGCCGQGDGIQRTLRQVPLEKRILGETLDAGGLG